MAPLPFLARSPTPLSNFQLSLLQTPPISPPGTRFAILLGQHEPYDTYKKLTAQALQARKRACNPRPRPRKRILYAAFEATKTTYPPSLLHHTIALRFLADPSQKPHDFAILQLWSNMQGLHANSVHTLWLAILAASKGPLITPSLIQQPDRSHTDPFRQDFPATPPCTLTACSPHSPDQPTDAPEPSSPIPPPHSPL